jgi:hypothetical protein
MKLPLGRIYPAKSRIVQPAPEAKVFWFFSSEKNKEKRVLF